jgi:hypothetical protein
MEAGNCPTSKKCNGREEKKSSMVGLTEALSLMMSNSLIKKNICIHCGFSSQWIQIAGGNNKKYIIYPRYRHGFIKRY